MKRRVALVSGLTPDVPAVRPRFADDFPHLWDHMTADRFEDGSSRETSTLMFFHDGSYFKAMLKDRAEGTVAFVSAVDIEGCILIIEDGLERNTLDWRRDQKPGGKGKRK